MNIEMLHEIQERISAEARSYCQDFWRVDKESDTNDGYCGTVGCLAGHATMIAGLTHGEVTKGGSLDSSEAYMTVGRELLDLTKDQAYRLFSGGGAYWPTRFKKAYVKAREAEDRQGMACAAVAAIEDFIETGGWPG